MRRRKLLIGLGALSAGGSAAFGTEAFTSTQAERNVDVAVAGDRSSFIAIQPLSSSNAGKYVNTENDDTVELELDGDGGGSGTGVAQDAITQLEDLFRVVNQGSQEVSVYFEDDSDAVTFRVTRSASTSTTGSNGQSLEGADNSVELAVGGQVVVGLTVDTLNNDVSGQLLDSAVLYADANASAPQQSIPEPQYVVDGAGDDPNTFETLSEALGSPDVSDGSVVGVEGSVDITEDSQITVEDSVTITGINGTPRVDATGFGSDGGAIQVDTNDVTLQNFELEYSDNGDGATNGIQAGQGGYTGLTLDGLTISNNNPTGQPAINVEDVYDITITNNIVSGGAIGVYYDGDPPSGTTTVSGNSINANPDDSDSVTEGIFIYGPGLPDKNIEVQENVVDNEGSSSTEIKVGSRSGRTANTVNGESGRESQLQSLLVENTILTAQVDADTGSIVTDSDSDFDSIQSAVDEVNALTLVESGSYTESVTVDTAGLTVSGLRDPVIDASGEKRGFDVKADGVTIRGLTVADAGKGVSSGEVEGIFVGNSNGFTDDAGEITIDDVAITNVDGTSKSTEGIHVKHYDDGDPINGVNISNVSIDGVDSGGAGGNGIKLQADVNNVDISSTTIENVTGSWGYGVVLTPSSGESGVPGSVDLDQVTIDGVDPRTFDGTGVGIDSASGDPEPATDSGKVADPDELSFIDVVIRNVDIGILERNTDKEFSKPDGVEFSSVRSQEIYDPSS